MWRCGDVAIATSTSPHHQITTSPHALRVMRRKVIRHAARGPDRRNRMLEDQMVHVPVFDNQRKAIEVLDAGFELASVEEMNSDRKLFAARVIEEDVLDI